jgi:hypothetical protein
MSRGCGDAVLHQFFGCEVILSQMTNGQDIDGIAANFKYRTMCWLGTQTEKQLTHRIRQIVETVFFRQAMLFRILSQLTNGLFKSI